MTHLTAKNFVIETEHSDVPVVVMFYAVWCGKCAMMKPVVRDIERQFKRKVKFCEVEIGECAALAAKFGTDIVPTFVLFRNGEIEGVMQGVIAQEIFEERVWDLVD